MIYVKSFLEPDSIVHPKIQKDIVTYRFCTSCRKRPDPAHFSLWSLHSVPQWNWQNLATSLTKNTFKIEL